MIFMCIVPSQPVMEKTEKLPRAKLSQQIIINFILFTNRVSYICALNTLLWLESNKIVDNLFVSN